MERLGWGNCGDLIGISAVGALHTSAVWLRPTTPETPGLAVVALPEGFEAQQLQHGATVGTSEVRSVMWFELKSCGKVVVVRLHLQC